jgi:carbamoyl-phosphate synthase small subunit
MRATLALEDGLILAGELIGAAGSAVGEVVFTTSPTGYQEVLSDPSYRGQIVAMAYPLIGNYGFHDAWLESSHPQAAGFVVRWAAPPAGDGAGDLDAYLRVWGITGIAGIDTRRLVRHLRTGGVRRGIVTTDVESAGDLVARARAVPDLSEIDLVAQVSTPEVISWPAGGPRIAVLDCGAKRGIVRHLRARGCEVILFPHDTSAAAIRAAAPAGLVVTNGPGDPARLGGIAAEVRGLWDWIPVMGICLGHQILAIAAGARTFKLPFGHRGSNHPVRDETTGRVAITTQNHGYAVDEASLAGSGFEVTHHNLHDGTVDSTDLFDRFLTMVRDRA